MKKYFTADINKCYIKKHIFNGCEAEEVISAKRKASFGKF